MIGKLEPEDRAVCSKGFVFKGESIFSLSFSLSFGRFFAIVFLGSFFLLSHSLFVSTFSHYFLSFFLFSPSFFLRLFALSLLLSLLLFRFSERSPAFDVIEGSGWISVKRLFVRGSCIGGIRFPVTVQPLDWGS